MQEPKLPSTRNAGAPTRFGHFVVRKSLGTGFSTAVYEAEAEGLGRLVVIKALGSTAGPETITYRRFEREARLLASLHHRNVVELLDFDPGVAGEHPAYMALEHVQGATLADLLTKCGRLEADEAAAIVLEIARGLAHAHDRGVVHRDVKPSNVLIGRPHGLDADAPVVVKLADFGVAVRAGEGDADAEESLGTPAYMAPEQLLGEAVDARSDQFALGIVLYQCLAGVRPFDGEDGRPQIQRVRRDPPRPLRAVGVTAPRTLERVVLRCLQKRPSDRFANTSELVDELSAYLAERLGPTPDSGALAKRVLARAGVLDERRSPREESVPSARAARQSPLRTRVVPLRPALLGLGLALFAMVSGGFAIQLRAGTLTRRKSGETSLRPIGPSSQAEGKIAVRVRPWAEVWIDGERIDVTPLREAIRVRPGRHVVGLQHPNAVERRTVDVPGGGIVTIDVVLDVGRTTFDDEFLPPPPPSASASASASSSAPPTPSTLTTARAAP